MRCFEIIKSSLNQPRNLLKYFISLKEETTVFLSKHGEEVEAAQKEPSQFEECLLVLIMRLQSIVSLFFSYAHPTDVTIQDEGKDSCCLWCIAFGSVTWKKYHRHTCTFLLSFCTVNIRVTSRESSCWNRLLPAATVGELVEEILVINNEIKS